MNCYNGQEYLKDSLNSVINQTYKNWELIFYDNCSNDKSKKIFFEYKKKNSKFKYFKSKKKEKLGVARYNALKKIKGSFFYFLIVMIIYYHQNLKHKLNFLKKKTEPFIQILFFFSKFRNRKNLWIDEKIKKKRFMI